MFRTPRPVTDATKAMAIMAAIVPDIMTFFLELKSRIRRIEGYALDKRAILNSEKIMLRGAVLI